jgi:hypothetical protein
MRAKESTNATYLDSRVRRLQDAVRSVDCPNNVPYAGWGLVLSAAGYCTNISGVKGKTILRQDEGRMCTTSPVDIH